jgi:glycosyltransferase involved in cell wall biosynthesis
MRVVFAHTDFRIYWPARLNALNSFLTVKGIEFWVVEIAGVGSPYSFAPESQNKPDFWHCIFPDKRMEEITAAAANKALIKKLDELQPDIVFSGAIAFPSGAASVRWAGENKKRCVVFDNARLEDVPRNKFINYIKSQVYSAVDAILCPAPSWNETFRYFGFTDEQIFHGLNVVDNSFWSELEYKYNPNLPDRYFLSIGRQIPKKNFLFLLKSYSEYLRVSKDPADLVLVGDGPRRSILEKFAKENDPDRIHLLPFSTQEDLRSIYRRSLCFILPSKHGETWGLVVNEAMASGLSVLVSKEVGCASTLVKDGINGFTFSPDDMDKLSGLMLRVEELTGEERNNMGQNSLEIIKNWGLDRFCAGTYEAIQYVSSNNKRKSSILSRVLIRLWKGRYRPV